MPSSLDQALEDAIRSVPECLLAGYLDLTTGVLINVKTIEEHPQEALDLLAATTAALFQDTELRTVENWLIEGEGPDDAAGEEGPNPIQECLVVSERLMHLFTRCQRNSDHVAIFVARKSANMGMAITRSRRAASALDHAV